MSSVSNMRGGRRARGVTMIEVVLVLVIVGILSSMAIPSLLTLARHYRALEMFRSAQAAVVEARALAQRRNRPVKVTFFPTTSVDTDGRSFVQIGLANDTNPMEIRRAITKYSVERTLYFDVAIDRIEILNGSSVMSTVNAGEADAQVVFCPSGDSYFREGTTVGVPVCGLGNIASRSMRIVMTAMGQTQNLRIGAALGSVELRAGST